MQKERKNRKTTTTTTEMKRRSKLDIHNVHIRQIVLNKNRFTYSFMVSSLPFSSCKKKKQYIIIYFIFFPHLKSFSSHFLCSFRFTLFLLLHFMHRLFPR